MGEGPRIIAQCVEEECRWETDTHVTDIRKFGVECVIHIDQFPTHWITLKLRDNG